MAHFDCTGLDDLIKDMEREGSTTGPRVDAALLAGAEAVKQAWRQSAQEHDLKRTGGMIAAIDYNHKLQTLAGARTAEIYPQGTNRQGTRYAQIAYTLHWGTTSQAAQRRRREKKMPGPGIPRTLWVDRAEEIAAPKVVPAMREAWEKGE